LVQNNFAWLSGYEKIDNFIKEMQLNIDDYNDIVFEWIPYNQFNGIEEIAKDNSITVYSAIWKDGPLCFNFEYQYYMRDSNKEVFLKQLLNLQNTSIDFLINEV
jgi:hypothetical protein